jgi:hypothetical protein
MMINECGAVGGIRIGRWDRSTLRKPALASFRPLEITHDLACDGTRATSVENQRLPA